MVKNKIQVMSDLHLERFRDEREIKSFLLTLESNADYVLIAGDTFSTEKVALQMYCVSVIFNDKEVIFIPGNHEYYDTSKNFMDTALEYQADQHKNITFLENDYKELDNDWIIIGACGWNDDFNAEGASMMNDFRLIRELRYDPASGMDWNRASKEFFMTALEKFSDKKVICMTHNSPIKSFIPSKYMGSSMNCFFANEWSDLIAHYEPRIWVSGHWHQHRLFNTMETMFVENGYGYHNYRTVDDFVRNMVILLD